MTTYDDAREPPLAVVIDRQRSLQASVTNILARLRGAELKQVAHETVITTLQADMATLTAAVERGNRILVGLLVSALVGSTSITVAILLSTKGIKL